MNANGQAAGSHSESRPEPLKFFAAVSLWLSLEFIILGPWSVIPIFDYADSWVAVQHVLKANLFLHGVTNWFPAMVSGADRLGQDYFYGYAPNFLALILPIWLSNSIHIVLQYFLGMVFVRRLCREHLGISEIGSTVAGVVFVVFCEFNPMLLGVYLFPLTIYYFDSIHRSETTTRSYLLTIALAVVTAFCSLVVYLPYTLPWLAVWFLLVRKTTDRKFWVMYGVYCATIVLLKVPSLAALLLNAEFSQRDFLIPGHKVMNGAFYLAFWGQTFAWLFRSAAAFVLVVLGAGFSGLRDKAFNVLLACLLMTTIGAALLNLSTLAMHISLAGYQFARFYLVSPLFYSICIAYACAHLPEKAIALRPLAGRVVNARQIAYAIVFVALFANTALAKFNGLKVWLRNGSYYAIFNSNEMKLLASARPSGGPFRVATSASLILPMYALSYGLEASDGYTNVYPMRYKQFWAKVIEPLTQKNEEVNRYFDNFGKRVYLFPPSEPPPAEMRFSDYYNLNLLSLANTRYFISRSVLIDDHLILVQKPAHEFYKLPRREQALVRVRENVSGNSTLFVYENTSVLPRFFVAGKVRAFEHDDEVLDALSHAGARALKDTIYVNHRFVDDLDLSRVGVTTADVEFVRYTPDNIRLNVKSDGACFLVGSNSYSPYWRAYVDAKPAPLIPADHAFWGVFLAAGDHVVRFVYEPPYRFFVARAD